MCAWAELQNSAGKLVLLRGGSGKRRDVVKERWMNVGGSLLKEDCSGIKTGPVFTDCSQEETVQAETAGGIGT